MRRGTKIIDRIKMQCDGVWHEIPVRLRTATPETPFLVDWTMPNGVHCTITGNNLQTMREELRKKLTGCTGINWERKLRVHTSSNLEEWKSPQHDVNLLIRIEPFWVGTRTDGQKVYAEASWDDLSFRGSQVRALQDAWQFENTEDDTNILIPDTSENRAEIAKALAALNGLARRLAKALKGVKDEKSLKVALGLLTGLK